jgi:2-C-methyl-D-erythritol 4-phosphate cytidylyltransferase
LHPLAGEPLLVHAVRRMACAAGVGCVVVAAPSDQVDAVRELLAAVAVVQVVAGGQTRQDSVAAALAQVPAHFEIILVHDAARALAPPGLAELVAAQVRGGVPAVVPVLPVVDTIKEVSASGAVMGTVDRSSLRAVQTPQGFRRSTLLAAHAAAKDPAFDDAALVERLGVPVVTVTGSDLAMKITRPVDLLVAGALLAGDQAGRVGDRS